MGRRRAGNYRFLDNYNWYVPGVADMFILLLWLLAGGLLGNVASLIFMAALGQDAAQTYGMLVSYPLMFIPAMMYASSKSRSRRYERPGVKLDSSHFGRRGGILIAAMVAAATVAAAFCSDLFNSMLPPMPEWIEKLLKGLTTGPFWVNLICVSIFAPLFEEWLCRGMVLRGLLHNRVRPLWAIVISALFFALIHMNPWQALPAFILGCLFGYVYYKTGSLKLTMLMHFTNNTLALICGHIDALQDMNYWTEVLPKGQYFVLFAAGLVLIALTVLELSRIASPKEGSSDVLPSEFE